KKGAKHITAIDIDAWACENSNENFVRNDISFDKFRILEGDARQIPEKSFDIVLANINRNILLSDIHKYCKHLLPGGQLILSGILEQDFDVIDKEAKDNTLKLETKIQEESWISIVYKK
ncbi:MAG: 50S ribosomal protein L11 methyltransferase, partial [Bacteroidales bacterium]